MSYLTFANPWALWLLAGVPALGWLLRRAGRKRREAVETFTSPTLAPRLLAGPVREAGPRSALLLAALALLIVAAARPRLGTRLERVERRGADILVAIDTSDSMLAPDASPSRLEAAKREVLGLIARLQGDRVGIITFSTQAFLYCPLTIDYDAATTFVESIDASITSGAGTALAAALAEAERAFGAGEGADRAVVLLSDGEDWGEGAREAAAALRAKGVRLYVLGIGTEAGAPVPEFDATGKATGMRKYEGKVVVSRLHAAELAELARAGGGTYFAGGQADHGAAAVHGRLSELQSSRAGEYTFRSHAERFQWPLGLALALLGAEFLMRVRPRRRLRLSLRGPGLAGTALACFLLTGGFSLFETPSLLCRAANRLFAEGKFGEALQRYVRALELDPENPILRFNAGDALYRQKEFEKAREHFGRIDAAGNLPLAARAHYNTGNSYLQEQKLDEAIEEYQNALRCDPGDALAKRNLEIARKLKEQQSPQDQSRKDRKQDEKEQKQQDSRQNQRQPQPSEEKPPPEPQASPEEKGGERQAAQAVPMTEDEARSLLRQAAYEDAQLRRELSRVMPRDTAVTGRDW
ncbi:MAG: VWA domain-containing protein [Armatimonadetes bacterium]|nr:VWA domain-containing protein [Armatimonadota bacterium]